MFWNHLEGRKNETIIAVRAGLVAVAAVIVLMVSGISVSTKAYAGPQKGEATIQVPGRNVRAQRRPVFEIWRAGLQAVQLLEIIA